MKRINLSKESDYYTQTNNRYVPMASCTPTSSVMFMLAEGIPVIESSELYKTRLDGPTFVHPQGTQPEDYITTLCQSPWGDDLRTSLTPWFDSTVPNQTIHLVVAEVLNRVIGKDVVGFFENLTIRDLYNQLLNRHPVMISGDFTHSGHTVVVVGMDYEDDDPHAFIIDDPYGNYHTNYRDKRGNDVMIEVDLFKRLWDGFEYGYFINKGRV